MSYGWRAFVSVHWCLVVTFWERADLLALVGDVFCIHITFPYGILGQVWYVIVSFPDRCRLSYFNCPLNVMKLLVFCVCLFLTVPSVDLQCVIMAFPGYTQILF